MASNNFIDTLPIAPLGISTAQTWRQVAAYFDAINTFNIRTFVEIGVDQGGLAILLASRSVFTNFYYLGIEIDKSRINPSVLAFLRYSSMWACYTPGRIPSVPGSDIIIDDALSSKVLAEVIDLIHNTDGRCLVLCDGGNKPLEVTTYAPLLRSGDLLTAHDYGTEINAADFDCIRETFIELGDVYEANLPLWMRR